MSLFSGNNKSVVDGIVTQVSRKTIIELIKEFLPKIGDIKYIAAYDLESMPNTDSYYNSSSFNGWVYADGRDISRTRFKDAFNTFSTTYGSGDGTTTFNIPKLGNFIKPSDIAVTKPNLTNKIRQYSSSCGVVSHNHSVDTKIKYAVDAVLTTAFRVAITGTSSPIIYHKVYNNLYNWIGLKSSQVSHYEYMTNPAYNDYIPAFHGGSGDGLKSSCDLNIPVHTNFSALPTKNAGEEYPNIYPTHMTLPVLIYIGKDYF